MTAPHHARPVSVFGRGRSSLDGITPDVVGFKAYNLMRMDRAGLRVPPGFVLHTELCRQYLADGGKLSSSVVDLIAAEMHALEQGTGLAFGDSRRPLLVSVRSGAPVSMPGMMDTLLDVGLTDGTVQGLIRRTGNPHLAWDSYRRLVATYTEVVHRGRDVLDAAVRARLAAEDVASVDELDTRGLRALTQDSLEQARTLTGHGFPQDPFGQLAGAVEAVFRSWNSERAVAYRGMHGLQDVSGTAVIVQAMVFGNAGGNSGSGVGFTRNPATGADELYFDFAFDAQGEDVVAGRQSLSDPMRLAHLMPEFYAELLRIRRALELEFGDMQDFEFTAEDGDLYMLQTRAGKRTPLAAVRLAAAMTDEGLIDARTALARIAEIDVSTINADRIEAPLTDAVADAITASSGIALGPIALDGAAAQVHAAAGRTPVLVRMSASTEDIEGFAAASGILAASGGRTSHAAVVARQMGKVCLVGCQTLEVDLDARCCTIGGRRFAEGDMLALDGNTGHVFPGTVTVERGPSQSDLEAIERIRALAQAPSLP